MGQVKTIDIYVLTISKTRTTSQREICKCITLIFLPLWNENQINASGQSRQLCHPSLPHSVQCHRL